MAGQPDPEPLSRGELRELRGEMKANAGHNHQLMNFIRAIETFSHPCLPMSDVAREILAMDSSDKNWRGQAGEARHNLNQLVKELQ